MDARQLVQQRYVSTVLVKTMRILIPDTLGSSYAHLTRFLYRGLAYTSARDALAFAMFFGTFDAVKVHVHHHVSQAFVVQDGSGDVKGSPAVAAVNASSVILAGGIAGVAYQGVVWPMDRSRRILHRLARANRGHRLARTNTAVSAKGAARVVRAFYGGIAPQLLRVFPPAAIGLFVFELANHSVLAED